MQDRSCSSVSPGSAFRSSSSSTISSCPLCAAMSIALYPSCVCMRAWVCMRACVHVRVCMCVHVCACMCAHVCHISYNVCTHVKVHQITISVRFGSPFANTKQQLNNILVSIVYGTVEGSLATLYVNVYTCVCVMCMCMHVHACVVSGWAYSPILKWQEYHLILWWADTVYYLELIMNCVTTISNNHCYLHI